MKLPGVLHDSVVHQKKRVKKNGKWEWTKPNFVKMKVHKLPGGRPWRWNVAPSTLTAAGNLLRNVCRKGRTFVLAWAACKPKFVLPSMSIGTGGTTCGCAQENSCPLTCLRLWFLRLERLCARTSPVRKKLLLCRRTCAWFLPSLCELHSQYWLEIYASSLPMIMQVYWMMIEDYSPPMTSEVPTSGLMTEVCSPPMTSEVPTSGLMTEVCSPPMTSEFSMCGLMTKYYHHSSTAGILRPFQTHKKGRLFRGGSIFIYLFIYLCFFIYLYIFIYTHVYQPTDIGAPHRVDMSLPSCPGRSLPWTMQFVRFQAKLRDWFWRRAMVPALVMTISACSMPQFIWGIWVS